MTLVISVFVLLVAIAIIYLKDGEWHKRLYLSRYEKSQSICNNNHHAVNILEYPNIVSFLDRFRGAGVLYRGDNDENYGPNLVNKLQEDGYRVLYFSVPKNTKDFYHLFQCIFRNLFWWSIEMPQHFLRDSNLIVILDNYDNMLDHSFDYRSGYSANIAIVYAANELLFKPIFIISKKEYANEVLQYNGHTKYYNLFSDKFYTLID
jgi:hypothetical protein